MLVVYLVTGSVQFVAVFGGLAICQDFLLATGFLFVKTPS